MIEAFFMYKKDDLVRFNLILYRFLQDAFR